MTHTHQATEGSVLAAIVEAGKAIYLAEESTAKSIAHGSQQQTGISENFVRAAEQAVTSSINSFNSYEAQLQASQHASFWSSFFSWVLVLVSVVASAFAGPETLVLTVALLVASKTGLLAKAQDALGNALGSKLLAGVILTAALVAVGAGAGGAAGAIEEDAGAVAEEAASCAADDAGNSAASSISSKLKSAGQAITKRIGSLSRTTAGGLNGFGQGLQNFNIGTEVAKEMAKLHETWASSLGITFDVLINLVAVASQGAGTGNGMMRATAAGKGICGTSVLVNNANLFKAIGVTGTTSSLGEGSCGVATGVLELQQAHSLGLSITAQAQSEFFDSVKELNHDGFSSWISNSESLEKSLSKEANDVGNSISAVNTQLAIAMSGRG